MCGRTASAYVRAVVSCGELGIAPELTAMARTGVHEGSERRAIIAPTRLLREQRGLGDIVPRVNGEWRVCFPGIRGVIVR